LKVLQALAKLCALIAGLLLIFITLMTCISVIGRDTIGKAIVGDFELTGAACGAAIALFMPWCQAQRGNIIVDFFTTRASEATKLWLDRAGALILAFIMALMAWRSALGGVSAWDSQSGSMMLGFPEWIVYSFIAPSLALTALIALHQAVFGFKAQERDDNPELAV
jgi:TRAP-type C4-dicarboxylate transport system permease small subunit